jgi:hypothetical protein
LDAEVSAEQANSEPVIRGLAGHVRECFTAAKTDKLLVEQRMLQSLRARRGEYDPDTLAKIRQTGGAEVFMMLSSSKARAATAWIRDVVMGNGAEKPWTLSPTKSPEVPFEAQQNAVQNAGQLVEQLHQMYGGPEGVPDSDVQDLLDYAKNRELVEIINYAKAGMKAMEDKMEDQLQEGGFSKALYEFTDDISTFPAAILKGPVVRNKPQLTWAQGAEGVEPVVENQLVLEWERVSPFNAYPSPNSTHPNDGYFIELHKLYPSDLEALIGVEGYSEDAIKEVIKLHGVGGLKESVPIATARVDAEGRMTSSVGDTTSPLIEALQFWGPVLGKTLVDFGMKKEQVPDETKTYHCEVWVVGSWVIKATLNYDPLGRRPYYKASWEEIPGAFWGNSPIDLIRDYQIMCNNAVRALANNVAVASGPQVDVNVDRLAGDEEVTNIYPWKVWQTSTDPYGNNSPPINFFQPQSNAAELMGIYEKFSSFADEASGIPKYLTGDGSAGGAGRTASGLSMMLQNAGKSIKSVIATVDKCILEPGIERLFYYNMRYGTDPALKRTDVKVVARGAASLIVKEQAQVRRNEFLNICLTSPVVSNIIGEEAIADLLRTMATGLDMDTDKIIPPPEMIKARMYQQRQQQIQQQALANQQAMLEADPTAQPVGAAQGPTVMPSQVNRQLPEGGGQTVNNFTPSRGA